MSTGVGREQFVEAYASEAPWDIGKPQPGFVAAADKVKGRILDAGCGTGDAALFFAERGHDVVGVDFIEEAIERAKSKAARRGLKADFRVMDAREVGKLGRSFDSIIDSGLFHTFSDEDRARYVDALGSVLKLGGRLFMMCFSDKEPGTCGPRRVSRAELEAAFREGWAIESVAEKRFETNLKRTDLAFSPGGPKALFVIVRRE
jgi:SAM-dependent methyltransferase